MNIQYQDEEQSSLLGSFHQSPGFRVPSNDLAQQTKEITHKVEYGDTLQGLSLTYDVPISAIKARNRLDSDSIYYLKEIIIPFTSGQPTLSHQELEVIKIEEFMAHMSPSERSSKYAKYYLSENQWDVQEAMQEYHKDLEWEKNYKVISKPVIQMQKLCIEASGKSKKE